MLMRFALALSLMVIGSPFFGYASYCFLLSSCYSVFSHYPPFSNCAFGYPPFSNCAFGYPPFGSDCSFQCWFYPLNFLPVFNIIKLDSVCSLLWILFVGVCLFLPLVPSVGLSLLLSLILPLVFSILLIILPLDSICSSLFYLLIAINFVCWCLFVLFVDVFFLMLFLIFVNLLLST